MNPIIPIHLENFDFITALQEWADAEPSQKRQWEISRWQDKLIKVRVSWSPESGQLLQLIRLALSAQEATSLVLKYLKTQT